MSVEDTLPRSPTESLAQLVSAIDRVESENLKFSDCVSIYFLRNFTIEPIEPYLKYYLFKASIRPQIKYGGYGTINQDVLGEDSLLQREKPHLIVLTLMLELLDPSYVIPGWCADKALTIVRETVKIIKESTDSLVVLNTFCPPLYPNHGLAAGTGVVDICLEVNRLNTCMRDVVANNSERFVLIDWQRLLCIAGENNSFDYRFWRLTKAPFKKTFLDLYAKQLASVVRALKGKSKKCLVLDCDNTLWGGVVGEDGIDGILLDRNDWPGAAYFEFQCAVKALYDRGVLITLCSKNNEADVWEVLDAHPHCVLKRSHLAGWRINWNNKVENITSLAQELNLGLDSFVFVDDNQAECALIRQALPEVFVFEVPRDLYEYHTLLFKKGLFDTLSVSNEDRQRARMYQQQQKRERTRSRFGDIEHYLKWLDIIARIGSAKPACYSRIAQLTQKTNQFNLTTRRYSEAMIQGMARDVKKRIFFLNVEDKFGPMGLTGVFIAFREGNVGIIDTMLLSCRILGRQLEFVFANECMNAIEREWKINEWQAEYVRTKKNSQVDTFWETVGFSVVCDAEDKKLYKKSIVAARSNKKYEELIKVVTEGE